MARYSAEFKDLTPEQIEALREVGAVRFMFEVDRVSGREALVRSLADEYEWRGLGNRDDWNRRLSRGRPVRGQEEGGDL